MECVGSLQSNVYCDRILSKQPIMGGHGSMPCHDQLNNDCHLLYYSSNMHVTAITILLE